ncbi:Opsin LWS1 [Halyomorpha halys]|nr:Opsin LWS1 [Halyomorpha halys]
MDQLKPQYAMYSWAQSNPMANKTVVDMVPPEMLHLVDAHWYQFPPMNPLWHGILGFVIGVLGVISILGNSMVIYIFSSTKTLRTPSNLLVVNLAFSDFLMMFTMFPPMVINCYHETWVFGPFMCEIYAMCGSLFGCASIWTMTMIALDRYNVIVKAVSAHEKAMREQAKKMNVTSLRGNDEKSAEAKLAKVALTTISLWFVAWTPYLVINYSGVFETATISPLFTIWGSLFAKANAVYNPIVYAISHPKYKLALQKKFPSLSCTEAPEDNTSVATGVTGVSEEKVSA